MPNEQLLYVKGHDRVSCQPINIQQVEETKESIFVGDFCLKTKEGWSETPVAIFYNPNPPDPSFSNYFGLFVDWKDQLMITDGQSAFSKPIIGIVADNGEVIFSRYRHDYVISSDGSVFIDGGRDYTKSSLVNEDKFVKLIIDKDKLVIQNK